VRGRLFKLILVLEREVGEFGKVASVDARRIGDFFSNGDQRISRCQKTRAQHETGQGIEEKPGADLGQCSHADPPKSGLI
jgi:hypothetical protein